MLTPNQLTAIDQHLRETNLLTNEELILELTDHYRTALNEHMQYGMTFETALTDVEQAFGGRKGLQKLERQYNKMTFRKYDQHWRQSLMAQFQKPMYWQTLLALLVSLIFSWVTYKPWVEHEPGLSHFLTGTFQGALLGSSFAWLSMLWPYLMKISFRGFHNIPTEVLYLVKRHIVLLVPFYLTGSIGVVFLPILPNTIQICLTSLYILLYYLFIRTGRSVYELLYDTHTA